MKKIFLFTLLLALNVTNAKVYYGIGRGSVAPDVNCSLDWNEEGVDTYAVVNYYMNYGFDQLTPVSGEFETQEEIKEGRNEFGDKAPRLVVFVFDGRPTSYEVYLGHNRRYRDFRCRLD